MALTDLELAEYAFNEANDMRQMQGAPALNYNYFERAKKYVDQGFEFLESLGYDPRYIEVDLASYAIIEYVKAKLIGLHPDDFTGFVRARSRWGEAAAAKTHYEEGLAQRKAEQEAKAKALAQGRLI